MYAGVDVVAKHGGLCSNDQERIDGSLDCSATQRKTQRYTISTVWTCFPLLQELLQEPGCRIQGHNRWPAGIPVQ